MKLGEQLVAGEIVYSACTDGWDDEGGIPDDEIDLCLSRSLVVECTQHGSDPPRPKALMLSPQFISMPTGTPLGTVALNNIKPSENYFTTADEAIRDAARRESEYGQKCLKRAEDLTAFASRLQADSAKSAL